MSANLLAVFYLISGVLFILALGSFYHQKPLDKVIYSELLEWL